MQLNVNSREFLSQLEKALNRHNNISEQISKDIRNNINNMGTMFNTLSESDKKDLTDKYSKTLMELIEKGAYNDLNMALDLLVSAKYLMQSVNRLNDVNNIKQALSACVFTMDKFIETVSKKGEKK